MEVLPDVVKVGTEADAQQGEERLEGPSPLGHAGLKPDSVPRWCRPRGGGLRAQGELGHARSAPHRGNENWGKKFREGGRACFLRTAVMAGGSGPDGCLQ